MIKYTKNVSETPLEMLERLKEEKPELKDEKLSYAGRLDPMAEGEVMVLVGEENKEYKEHLKYDKEYEAVFIAKVSTDTGDVLGLITETGGEVEKLEEQVEALKGIKEQKYPWFSSMTVDGKKLFDHFKSGNTDIERPSRKVSIKEVELLESGHEKVQEYILKNVAKVNGKFRQKETITRWKKYFEENKDDVFVFKVRILVSTGTYIRGLTENFNFPTTLLKLKRVKILT
ncbi:MAG: tRNA pseudouridine(55) synthase [Candidatus Paceibacteria bacterium]|jgi:tRNA pseudouridine(55) synthase